MCGIAGICHITEPMGVSLDTLRQMSNLFNVNIVTKLLKKLRIHNNSGEIDNLALIGILSSQIIHHQFVDNFVKEIDYSISSNLIVYGRSQALKSVN